MLILGPYICSLLSNSDFIHLTLCETPDSNTILNMRSGSSVPPRKRFSFDTRAGLSAFKNVGSWVTSFDTHIRLYQGRLVVCVKLDEEVGCDPEAEARENERCKPWIGLES